jgi:hypothetical protein
MLYDMKVRLFPVLENVDTEVPAVSEFIDRINESIAITGTTT